MSSTKVILDWYLSLWKTFPKNFGLFSSEGSLFKIKLGPSQLLEWRETANGIILWETLWDILVPEVENETYWCAMSVWLGAIQNHMRMCPFHHHGKTVSTLRGLGTYHHRSALSHMIQWLVSGFSKETFFISWSWGACDTMLVQSLWALLLGIISEYYQHLLKETLQMFSSREHLDISVCGVTRFRKPQVWDLFPEGFSIGPITKRMPGQTQRVAIRTCFANGFWVCCNSSLCNPCWILHMEKCSLLWFMWGVQPLSSLGCCIHTISFFQGGALCVCMSMALAFFTVTLGWLKSHSIIFECALGP